MSDDVFRRTDTADPGLAHEAAAIGGPPAHRSRAHRSPLRRSLRSMASWRFVRHLAEMVLAMLVGMAVLGLVLGAVGEPPGYRGHPLYRYLLMSAAMAVPMVGWMRYRGHSWSDGAQMTAAMVAPVIVLVTPLELGLAPPGLSAMSLMMAVHVLMVVAMAAWLALRWDRSPHGEHT